MSSPIPVQADVPNLGPGTLSFGETGAAVDVSALLNGARITASKDQDDPTTKLSGVKRAGAVSYTYELTGNIDADIATSTGFFALSQAQAGQEIAYKFTPNTAAGAAAAGKLILDPLDFGADEYGDTLTSDFTFSLTDKPVYSYAEDAALGDLAVA